jgi:hypothetical protein
MAGFRNDETKNSNGSTFPAVRHPETWEMKKKGEDESEK